MSPQPPSPRRTSLKSCLDEFLSVTWDSQDFFYIYHPFLLTFLVGSISVVHRLGCSQNMASVALQDSQASVGFLVKTGCEVLSMTHCHVITGITNSRATQIQGSNSEPLQAHPWKEDTLLRNHFQAPLLLLTSCIFI